MALTVEEVKITFDLDELTWGDMEDITSGNTTKFLDVCARLGRVDGKTPAEVRGLLRQLKFEEINTIDQLLSQAIQGRSNPPDDTGKN